MPGPEFEYAFVKNGRCIGIESCCTKCEHLSLSQSWTLECERAHADQRRNPGLPVGGLLS
jgi:hypothetical protein